MNLRLSDLTFIQIGIITQIFYNLGVESIDSTQFERDIQLLWENLGPLPKPVERPVFIVLSGLPGTGKSYFSQKLAKKFPLVILESDALCKVLFPEPTYSWRESARLFRACDHIIEKLLSMRISLILDATNLSERYRRKLYNIAKRAQAKFILVKIEAPPEIVRERLAGRTRIPDRFSDADWRVYEAMKSRVEEIQHDHLRVNTHRDINPVINKIIREAKK